MLSFECGGQSLQNNLIPEFCSKLYVYIVYILMQKYLKIPSKPKDVKYISRTKYLQYVTNEYGLHVGLFVR